MSSVDLKARAKAAMKRRHLTQQAVAEQVGVSSSQLSQIFSRKSKPSIDVAVAIERVLRIPARDFAEPAL
jgi:transcriptional regulator with XRE-family HTH domain